ncbi:MAG TPA: translocation/assembly module TamB domain-containing protein, partial [Moraxellaceae bacterium]|nr:translocation/assembly module TamB domain-containing protein [Moraxellaceae bacterium]
MWHHHVRRAGRHLWRVILVCLVLAMVAAGAVLAVLGSETGSRWLLTQGLEMQRSIEARYEGGTFLGGLQLADVRYRSAKTDVRIRRLMARWSLWGLLRGQVVVSRLALEEVDLRRMAPPSPDKTVLPVLILPFGLHLESGTAVGVRYWPWGATHPYALRNLALADAIWRGTHVRFHSLQADQDRIGHLALAGWIQLRGGYPLEAKGYLTYLPFRDKGWGDVEVSLSRQVDDLGVDLHLARPAAVEAHGRIATLEPQLPYQAEMKWRGVNLPWWSDQSLQSDEGHLRVAGNKNGLHGSGAARIEGRHVPAGQYRLDAQTDWRSARIGSLDFTGLGGSAHVTGDIGWQAGLSWALHGRMQGVDLARKWPVPRVVLPVISGNTDFSGKTSAKGSEIHAALSLAGGEHWEVTQRSSSWAWDMGARQELTARWKGVTRTLDGGRTIASEGGHLDAFGSRDRWQAQVDGQVGGGGLPSGQWVATLQGQGRKASIPRLDYRGDAGGLGFQGELEIASPLRWSGQLMLDHFASGWLFPKWSGQLSGQVTGQGEWGNGRRNFSLSSVHLEGGLRDQPFRLDGPVDVQLAEGDWPSVHSGGLTLQWGRDHVFATGGLKEGQWDLATQFQLADIALIAPEVAGGVDGQLTVDGPQRRPDVQVHLTGTDLATSAVSAHDVRVDATVQSLGEKSSQIAVSIDGMTTSGGRDLGRLSLSVDGTRDRQSLDWRLDQNAVQGHGALSGALVDDGWQGRMDNGSVTVAGIEWTLAAPFDLRWQGMARQLTLAPHCWTSDDAKFCNEEEARVGEAGHLRLALSGLSLERLHDFWPEGLEVAGQVHGQAAGDWEPGQTPSLKAGIEADKGQVRLLRDEGLPPIVQTFDRIGVTTDAGLASVDLGVDLVSADMGQGQARVHIDPRAPGKPLVGDVRLDGFRLGVFQPFFPALATLSGQLSAAGQLGGVLERPAFEGQIRIDGGELAMVRLPLHVRDLVTRIDVHGTSAEINGSMKSGNGGATLAGTADWAADPRLALTLKGQRFQLSQPPELQAEVNPDLALAVAPHRVDLTGSVTVPTGRLNLKRLTDRAVPLSTDVRLVRASDREAVQVTGQVQDWSINADIRLLLGDDVYFQGFGVTGRLEGGLRILQEGRRGLEASGEVALDKESRYEAYGQRLQIRRGRLIFAGNLTQPGLDVEAIRTVDDKVVGVRVEGRANQPEATLFSDTPMSQEEMVSYLVLGRPLDTSGRPDGGGSLTAAAAAIKLGATGAGGVGLTNRVGETLGISDL